MPYFLMLVLFISACQQKTGPRADPLADWTLVQQEAGPDFSIKTLQRSRDEHLQWRASAKDVSPSDFTQFLEVKSRYLKNLYSVNIEPYYGSADKDLQCLKKIDLDPVVRENGQIQQKTYSLPLDSRFEPQVCEVPGESFRGEIHFIYCRQIRRQMEIRIFQTQTMDHQEKINLDLFCR